MIIVLSVILALLATFIYVYIKHTGKLIKSLQLEIIKHKNNYNASAEELEIYKELYFDTFENKHHKSKLMKVDKDLLKDVILAETNFSQIVITKQDGLYRLEVIKNV